MKRNSLPQIFTKNIYDLPLPQKQSQQYSLFIRTNNFTLKASHHQQSRYNNCQNNNNKSVDGILSERRKDSLSKNQGQNLKEWKNLLTTRQNYKKTHSKSSYFIEQTKNSGQQQQVDSFKSIRKRIIQELTLLQASLATITKSQQSIKQSFDRMKTNQLQELTQFDEQMRGSINALRQSFKKMKSECRVEIKLNKQQAAFLQQQTENIKSIMEGFELQSDRLRHELIMGTVYPNNRR